MEKEKYIVNKMNMKFNIYVMKKIISMLFCAICLIACEKEEEILKIQTSQLVGEWVYDHPEKGIWEKQKFVSSGAFYYSNRVVGEFIFSNDVVDGTYKIIDGNKVNFSYNLNNKVFSVTMTMFDITDYSYTAEYNDGESLGVFTYAKLLGNYEMERGDIINPNYLELVDTQILGYRSHQPSVAVVDPTTGEITAVAPGRTYIDLITNEGTAVVEVTVLAWHDFVQDLGKTENEIFVDYGTPFYSAEGTYGKDIYYMLHDDFDIKYLVFTVNPSTKKTSIVNILLKENYNIENILDMLSEQYYYYAAGSEEEEFYYAFTHKETLQESNIGITFDGLTGVITFLDLDAPRTVSIKSMFINGRGISESLLKAIEK